MKDPQHRETEEITMDEALARLNPSQREAVTTTEGYVRVIAGAGSGKTRTLSTRFAYLVNALGILPGNILCVTFSNKAAGEMRRRIHLMTGDSDTGYINTFHGFCVSVLQEDSHAVSYPKSFLVLDNSDIDSMLRLIYEERQLSLRDMSFSAARDMIEMQKLYKKPEYYEDLIAMPLELLREKYEKAEGTQNIIFYGYLYQQKKCFGLDYNDLIKFTLHIFREDEDIRLKWQKRLEYIMIDEFQDIDMLQYELMEQLCAFHKNLFIVGDPDQTIYTWRGANVRYLLDFDRNFPGTRTIMMMQNYRSTPQILQVCNALIAKNRNRIRKDLLPMLPDGESVLCHHGATPELEAAWIVSAVQQLQAEGTPLGRIALLYRAHYVTRVLEEALLAAKLPYTIYSGVQFYDRAEIKDALSYLRMAAFKDDLSFMRVVNTPKRNIGKRRMDILKQYAAARNVSLYEALRQNLEDGEFASTKAAAFVSLIEDVSGNYRGRPVSELLAELLNRSGYEKMLRTEGSQDRLDNLAELKQAVYEFETGCGEEAELEGYLRHVALCSGNDGEEAADRLHLMTVHAAKGLEFENVFLCAMNEGIFPSRKVNTQQAMEEERRLAFVAVTRAQKRLFISEAEGRSLDGSPRFPSRFILDIGAENLVYDEPPREDLLSRAKEAVAISEKWLADRDAPLPYAAGDRICHPVFGDGTVEALDPEKQACIIRFDGIDTPRTISLKVKLKKL